MKQRIFKPVIIAFISAVALLAIAPADAKNDKKNTFEYKIGDAGPGGGWIFFVDYNDQYPDFTYLEAAPDDASTGTAWCGTGQNSNQLFLDVWDEDAVGRGRANTNVMLTNCTSGAAYAADGYSTSTTSPGDWFLPSIGEAMLMYTNLRQAGVGSFAYAFYWSSSEYSSNDAWFQFFYSGSQGADGKSNSFRVRAVRAF